MYDRANQGNCERDCGYDKKWWGDEGFQDINLGEIQELIDTTQEELTENILMEMSALEPVPDDEEEKLEEAVPGTNGH